MKISKPFHAVSTSMVVLSILFVSPAFAQTNPSLSDAEVASVAVVANQIDISYAEIAKKKSKDAEVLKFAQTMINDHNAVIGPAAALAKKLGVTPKDNAVSQGLLKDAEKTKKTLRSKSGKAFNKAYVDYESAYHQTVIPAVKAF